MPHFPVIIPDAIKLSKYLGYSFTPTANDEP